MSIPLLVLAAWLQDAVATPVPTPEAVRLIAALETEQAGNFERTALFTDRTIVHSTVFRGRRLSVTRSISSNEVEVLRRVASESAEIPSGEFPSGVIGDDGRTIRIEVTESSGKPRHYRMDELSLIPLSIARLRGALLELQDRFYKERGKEDDWDPSVVRIGTVLRRRGDGRRFVVTDDDRVAKNIELEELEGGARLFQPRADLPRVFEKPDDEAPR